MFKLPIADLLVPALAALPLLSGLAAGGESLPPGLYARMITDKGEIVLFLEFEKTPMTVMNFAGLAEGKIKHTRKDSKRLYDGLTFHRVIADFMIQGGDPDGTGGGGPGYRIAEEIVPELRHDRAGILSMAKTSAPNTTGSQFFITHVPTPHLDDLHTVFGHVVTGQNVVNAIAQGDKMKSVEIIAVGPGAEAFLAGINDAAFKEAQKTAAAKAKAGDLQDKTYAEKRLAAAEEALKKAPAGKDTADRLAFVRDAREKLADAAVTPEGLLYIVLQEGAGKPPKKGAAVQTHYTGYFLDGNVFDSSRTRGEPFSFKIGVGDVISGWDLTLADMKPGERRLVFIPYAHAYGEGGHPAGIPPKTMLVFDMELLK
jgi:peptidylprolyl isomerase